MPFPLSLTPENAPIFGVAVKKICSPTKGWLSLPFNVTVIVVVAKGLADSSPFKSAGKEMLTVSTCAKACSNSRKTNSKRRKNDRISCCVEKGP